MSGGWKGGLASHGGVIGIVLGCIFYGKRHDVSILHLFDLCAITAPIGIFFGRIANFINNELWGRPTDLPWGVVFPIPPEWQAWLPTVPRHPSQLYEAALEGLSAQDCLARCLGGIFEGESCIVSSFGTESAVILHMASQVAPDIPVLFIDTGKLFEETHRYRDRLAEELGLTYGLALRLLVAGHGAIWPGSSAG